MNNFLNGFIKKCKRWGFTLAEALVVTVMAGYAILPILGTMQNASKRAEAYDHRSKMVQYTRSRLTKEIANASFDHCAVSTEDMYHYIVYFDSTGDENKAVRMEIPETYINPDELLTIKGDTTVASGVCDLFGLNSDITPSAYMQIIYAYRTSVQTNDGILLATYTEDISSTTTSEPGPKGLLGIVVTTRLVLNEDIPYDDDGVATGTGIIGSDYEVVEPVSNFSLVNLPTVSDEFIWLADCLNSKLYGIDPVSRIIVSTITIANNDNAANKKGPAAGSTNNDIRPWHIAVHPSNKMLVVQRQRDLVLVNIDRKSKDFNEKKYFDTKKQITSPKERSDDAYKDGNVVFSPDGKFIFYSAINSESLIEVASLSYSINSSNCLNWSATEPKITSVKDAKGATISASIKGSEVTSMVPGADGYLYISFKGNNIIQRVPMHSENNFANWQAEDFVAIATESDKEDKVNLAVSPDGTRLAATFMSEKSGGSMVGLKQVATGDKKKARKLIQYSTRDGRIITETDLEGIKPVKIEYSAFTGASDNLTSSGILNIVVTDETIKSEGSGSDNQKRIAAKVYDAGNGNFLRNIYVNTNEQGKGKGKGKEKTKEADIRGGHIVVSPNGGSIIMTDKQWPSIYFATASSTNIDEVLTDENDLVKKYLSGNKPETEKSCSDMVSTRRDILGVAYNNSSDTTSTNTIQLFDLNTMTELEDETFSAKSLVSTLAMTPNGESFLGAYDDTDMKGLTKFNISDLSVNDVDTGLRKTLKLVVDDSYPTMAFTQEPSRDGEDNAFWSVRSDNWEHAEGTAYNRSNFDIISAWNRLDMIGLPKGGALVLYGKADGSSMLEWIGRNDNAYFPDIFGKYKLFARWANIVLGGDPELKNIPNKYDNSFSSIDEWSRVIIRCSDELPAGHVIKQIKLSNKGNSVSENCYITPVLLQSADNANFRIVDYAKPISVADNDTDQTFLVEWKKGGLIGSNYTVGWWSGNSDSENDENKGAINYKSDDSSGSFYSDMQLDGTNPDEHGYDFSDVLSKALTDYSGGSGKRRNYSIQFMTEPASSLGTSFPPLHSKKIAMTPDMGMLAILSGEDGKAVSQVNDADFPRLSLYDFNNQIYGQDTQIEGMFVDYRETKQSGAYGDDGSIVSPTYNWPEETDGSLFGKVQKKCELTGPTGLCLNQATTKNDDLGNYKEEPGNFANNDSNESDNKITANKRIFGYFRPEYSVSRITGLLSEDVRMFYNQNMIAGRLESADSSSKLLDSSSVIASPYMTSLLQIDQTNNLGKTWQSVLLIKDSSKNLPDNIDRTTGKKCTITTPDSNYEFLKSEQTYLLYNHPVFMGALPAKSSDNKIIGNLLYTQLIFSRDRAYPFLYILDSKNQSVWYLEYFSNKAKSLIRAEHNFNAAFAGNPAISSDGSKLLVGTDNNKIKAINIAKPEAATGVIECTSRTPDSYMGLVDTFTLDAGSEIKALATKPFVSYSSADAGGSYSLIDMGANGAKIQTNTALAVASGGVYILDGANHKIQKYDVINNEFKSEVASFAKSTYYAPMTAYDDVLYVMGHDGNPYVATDTIMNSVQSYDVNTGKKMFSISTVKEQTDGYIQMNIPSYASNFEKFVDIFTGKFSDYGQDNDGKNVFDNDTSDSKFMLTAESSDDKEKYIAYKYKNTDLTFKYNVLCISNEVYNRIVGISTINSNHGVKKLDIYGLTNSQIPDGGSYTGIKLETFDNITQGSVDESLVFSFPDTSYQGYAFYTKENYAGYMGGTLFGDDSERHAISELRLCRGPMRCLIPRRRPDNPDSNVGINSGQYTDFIWNSDRGDYKVTTSMPTGSDYSLYDCYVNYQSGYLYTDKTFNNLKNTEPSDNWRSGGTTGGVGDHPWIKFSLPQPDIANVFRYCNSSSSSNYLKGFTIYGSTATDSDPRSLTGWTLIKSVSGLDGISKCWVPIDLENNTKYKHYLFYCDDKDGNYLSLGGVELWADGDASFDSDNPSERLTGMLTDSCEPVKIGANAACATPYGLVVSGGHFNPTDYATNTVTLYWPHAINMYDGVHTEYGISRSLPALNPARFNHSMVWHKGRLYVLGGALDATHKLAGSAEGTYAAYLDGISSGIPQWVSINHSDFKPVSADITVAGMLGFYQGVCSYGDEIFIFGGQDKQASGFSASAYAWNPETGRVRKLRSLPEPSDPAKVQALSPCSAVVFGSKIYIYGMNNSTSPATPVFFEYTP